MERAHLRLDGARLEDEVGGYDEQGQTQGPEELHELPREHLGARAISDANGARVTAVERRGKETTRRACIAGMGVIGPCSSSPAEGGWLRCSPRASQSRRRPSPR